MNKAVFNRRLRQLHLWFAVAIGAQIGLWLISGLFMTWFPIENVRGNHLKADIEAAILHDMTGALPVDEVLLRSESAPKAITLRIFGGQPVWMLETQEKKSLIDAKTGEVLTPLSEQRAHNIANIHYAGTGSFKDAVLYETPPREYGGDGPVWQINYSGKDAASFYVDASNGEVRAVRTGLWRTFDFMWGLHIMDWKERDNFNSWWLKMTASLAVIFFLTGLSLAFLRFKSLIGRTRRR